jgi:hypothetical protein
MSCGLTPSTTTSARTALQRLARAPCTGGREKSTRAPRRVTPAQRRPVAVVRACMLIRSCFTLPGVPYPSQARLHSGFRMGWPFARLQPAHPPPASQTEHYAIHVLVPIPTTALWLTRVSVCVRRRWRETSGGLSSHTARGGEDQQARRVSRGSGAALRWRQPARTGHPAWSPRHVTVAAVPDLTPLQQLEG